METSTVRMCRVCGHQREKFDDERFMSLWAYWWRKMLHPDHFRLTAKKIDIFSRLGWNWPGRALPKVKNTTKFNKIRPGELHMTCTSEADSLVIGSTVIHFPKHVN